MSEFLFIASGLVVGVIIGVTGVGGGSLMTPWLIMGFGISPSVAVGTDLLFAAVTKCGGTIKLAKAKLV
ncbi:MAG: TSUP family transporter, partial [Burkholderiaceae bacterium]